LGKKGDKMLDKLNELELLTLVIFGEARGLDHCGRLAVGCVVRNRVMKNKTNYKIEILKPYQFSCFNPGDPNRELLERIAKKIEYFRESLPPIQRKKEEQKFTEEIFNRLDKTLLGEGALFDCYTCALAVMKGCQDITTGATHYIATYWAMPEWIKGMRMTKIIGQHVFFVEKCF